MTDGNDPLYQKIMSHLPSGAKPGDYITSLEIKAQKPGPQSSVDSLFTPAVAELVAIGAALAANCEPCFKHHYDNARKLGISLDDMISAVNTAHAVKQTPARAMLELADRLLQQPCCTPTSGPCCSTTSDSTSKQTKCCS
jgi:AhpD family alkylhydroperoxidase